MKCAGSYHNAYIDLAIDGDVEKDNRVLDRGIRDVRALIAITGRNFDRY